MKEKVRVGVLGAARGSSMIKYCVEANNAELVAICDKNKSRLEEQESWIHKFNITLYDDFDEFIKHDMDAVVLANYADEHAPFAIRCMKAGKHVFSEVLPVKTLKEAVELVECVEETGMIYAYGENYCYMPAPYEMRRLYREGVLGELEYAEGEYIHNCVGSWHHLTYGNENHWRNNMFSTFYCTHSFGPIMHSTGLRPVSVIGFEGTNVGRVRGVGRKGGLFAVEMVTMENGAIVKSVHGDLRENSIWYTMYGSNGRVETAREDSDMGDVSRIFTRIDENPGKYLPSDLKTYRPSRAYDQEAGDFGHGNSDFYTMWHFIEKIKGNPEADIIDVYEALDMGFVGLFAYRSILAGNKAMEIPNLRDKSVRDAWRNDVACWDPKVAGDQLLPTYSGGTPDIPREVYEEQRQRFEEWLEKEREADLKAKA